MTHPLVKTNYYNQSKLNINKSRYVFTRERGFPPLFFFLYHFLIKKGH